MKQPIIFITISIVIFSLFSSCATTPKKEEKKIENTIIGRWEGVDRTGKMGAFEFFNNGNVLLVIDGRPLGGPDTNGSGSLKYTVDYSKDPIELDIIGADPNGAVSGKILMIVRFLSTDKIKIRTFFNDIRPENFDNETIDDTILLDRKTD